MDIEKLKRCLKCCADDNSKACNKCELEYGEEECQNLCGYAATALSALQAENEKLRDEVERQRRSADNRQHLYENAERAYMKVLAELEQAKREQSRIPEGYALVKLELLEELDNFRDLGPIDRLRELKKADDEGRCVVLPVKPDTPVWSIAFCKVDDDGTEHPTGPWPFSLLMLDAWGEEWFLTREEAEKALEE